MAVSVPSSDIGLTLCPAHGSCVSFLKPLKVRIEMAGLRSKERQVRGSGQQSFNRCFVRVCEDLWQGL